MPECFRGEFLTTVRCTNLCILGLLTDTCLVGFLASVAALALVRITLDSSR